MGDFHADEAHVIRHFVAGVTFEQGDDFVERGAEREVGALEKFGLEPFGTEQFAGRASILEAGPERDRIYSARAQAMPRFAKYQEMTTRLIPVVVIERA